MLSESDPGGLSNEHVSSSSLLPACSYARSASALLHPPKAMRAIWPLPSFRAACALHAPRLGIPRLTQLPHSPADHQGEISAGRDGQCGWRRLRPALERRRIAQRRGDAAAALGLPAAGAACLRDFTGIAPQVTINLIVRVAVTRTPGGIHYCGLRLG
jgi:hypothetical protein